MVDGHDVFQGVFEPLERVHVMFPADGEERIDHGCPLRRFVASGEQVVFPANGNRPDGILNKVVVII